MSESCLYAVSPAKRLNAASRWTLCSDSLSLSELSPVKKAEADDVQFPFSEIFLVGIFE